MRKGDYILFAKFAYEDLEAIADKLNMPNEDALRNFAYHRGALEEDIELSIKRHVRNYMQCSCSGATGPSHLEK